MYLTFLKVRLINGLSLDELLPSAERYGKHHLSIIGLVAGMFVMAISLFLFI